MEGKPANLVFDNMTGNFIVTVKMPPKLYSRFVQEQTIPDVDSVTFEKDTGHFILPVYMTPKEYGDFAQDGILPKRYKSYNKSLKFWFCKQVTVG